MPTFSLGRLGRFQVSRLLPPNTSSPIKRHDLPSSPPPEYTKIAENETKFHAPSQAQPPECKIEQLRRFLIEIVAITLGANFDELNAALHDIPIPTGTNTILCDDERANLLSLSSLVRKVHKRFLDNEKTRIVRKDEEKIIATITKPVKNFDPVNFTIPLYSLDLIGWYGEEVRSPSGIPWASTIPGFWDKTPPWPYSSEHKHLFEDSMRAFCIIFESVAPNDRVRDILWEAWDDSRRRYGLGDLGIPSICWPLRGGYQDMGESLQKMTPSEPRVVVGGLREGL
ncbi:hypothetical protein AA0113_g8787 [Alternaria arborescens]|uniref:Uncharacterized protein n=1 Tax=Alternaria arborescens TaxID=156630 RepID=A0A4Q4RFU1_9PLEO|nr:hypothetical protein AA0112_g11253 [Alternaria arborescens]RYO55569.1 hypothetical protein AA0113_g8787 [Alternaria arborescens]